MEKVQMQKRLNRARLLEFEREIEEKLLSLNGIEQEMKTLGTQRRDWLDNIAHNHVTGSDIYLRRVELVRAQSEQLSLQLKMNILKVESVYETQRLSKLVELTRPLAEKETENDRILALQHQARRDNDDLQALLQQALERRLQIGHEVADLSLALNRIQQQSELEQEEKADVLIENLTSYCDSMSDGAARANQLYSDIMREYLVLRHNSQVAREILLRNQHDATFARQQLQEKLQKMTKDAATKRIKNEVAAQKELKLRLTEHRASVVRAEKELEEAKLDVRELRKLKKSETHELLAKIARMEEKLRELQQRRSVAAQTMSQEVALLRHNLAMWEQLPHNLQHFGALHSTEALHEHLQAVLRRLQRLSRRSSSLSRSRSRSRSQSVEPVRRTNSSRHADESTHARAMQHNPEQRTTQSARQQRRVSIA